MAHFVLLRVQDSSMGVEEEKKKRKRVRGNKTPVKEEAEPADAAEEQVRTVAVNASCSCSRDPETHISPCLVRVFCRRLLKSSSR